MTDRQPQQANQQSESAAELCESWLSYLWKWDHGADVELPQLVNLSQHGLVAQTRFLGRHFQISRRVSVSCEPLKESIDQSTKSETREHRGTEELALESGLKKREPELVDVGRPEVEDGRRESFCEGPLYLSCSVARRCLILKSYGDLFACCQTAYACSTPDTVLHQYQSLLQYLIQSVQTQFLNSSCACFS